MELQTYINNHSDFISEFKKQGFKVNTFKDLKIISYPYDKKPLYESNSDFYKLYLRGAVINKINKVVCLPPVKSFELTENSNISTETQENKIVYETLLDGTMINLFYHNDKWTISTRSEIGGYNKWQDKKSFREMFDECCNLDENSLDKTMSYSFVMRHKENRNVTPIYDNILILVEAYRYSDDTIQRVDVSQLKHFDCEVVDQYSSKDEFMKLFEGPVIPYHVKGYNIKCGPYRYKWLNPYFEEVRGLKINMNNHLLNYVELRRDGNLKNYLRYFPEHIHLFNNYKEKIHSLSNDLFKTYKGVFIYKNIDKKDIPYHLRPLIYDVHGKYLESREPTSWSSIKDYIHEIPSKKLVFALNYL
tara:strand:+ start:92 stop:1174 length:1083 start_codon:yes stop_codon:yes gene_type:complete